ncbi:redox-sensitive transcriptional activator SoxR [Brevibacterium sp. UCMA 11754]|uniref:redox-sensitive transcriptional activator SoxR n=1 Tax=Brevibacterium sp. UCMA 11754 TaxID=2749198 RepID=UPI001F19C11E|nr:redox-sensitive transcriptional activator SoxR [Brevibacterium sp. UCMA 11754]MCF2572686.1 redox-sensitive transcriptional activator SoxR [Brevibacterium sp. UCMA 11754]
MNDSTPSPTDLLSVGDVAERTGVAVSALHFYERQGLISATRTAGGQRRFARHVIRRVTVIQVAKRMGIPLVEVSEVFSDLPKDRMPGKSDWRRISERWRGRLEARRKEIQRMEEELVECIGCGCVSLRSCRVLNPDDELGSDGSGPRLLPEFPVASSDSAACASGIGHAQAT